jgi:four helix bundle protein
VTTITRFEDIEAWQAARRMNIAFGELLTTSRTFTNPNLADQMQRAAESAMANIAEGFDAHSDKEFVRFLNIAYRSASEFQSHLYPARDQRQIAQRSFDSLYEMARETKALIGGFRCYLERCIKARERHRRRRCSQSKSRRRPRTKDLRRPKTSGDLGPRVT